MNQINIRAVILIFPILGGVMSLVSGCGGAGGTGGTGTPPPSGYSAQDQQQGRAAQAKANRSPAAKGKAAAKRPSGR